MFKRVSLVSWVDWVDSALVRQVRKGVLEEAIPRLLGLSPDILGHNTGSCLFLYCDDVSDSNVRRGFTVIHIFPSEIKRVNPFIAIPTEKNLVTGRFTMKFSDVIDVGPDVAEFMRFHNPDRPIWTRLLDAPGPGLEVQSTASPTEKIFEVVCPDRFARPGFIATGIYRLADFSAMVAVGGHYMKLPVQDGPSQIGVHETRVLGMLSPGESKAQFDRLWRRASVEFRLARWLTQTPPYHVLFSEIFALQKVPDIRAVQKIVAHSNGIPLFEMVGQLHSGSIPVISFNTVTFEPRLSATQAQKDALPGILSLMVKDLLAACAWAHANRVIFGSFIPTNSLAEVRMRERQGQLVRELRLKFVGYSRARLRVDSTFCVECSRIPGFSSPEQIRGEKTDTSSDVFIAGLTLFFMAFGRELDITICNLSGLPITRDALDQNVAQWTSEGLGYVFSQFLQIPAITQFARDAWGLDDPSALLDLIRQMITPDPAARPTAEQLLQHPYFNTSSAS